MAKLNIKEGSKYARLTIVKETERVGNSRMFLCRCDCGTEKTFQLSGIVHGKVRSCGCLKNELTSQRTKTHGLSKHRLFSIWNGMMQRCYNKKQRAYKAYGAKGITVCEEWHNIENFIKDMDDSFKPGLTIDRASNNKGYCKENCRWATQLEQQNNRTDNVRIIYNEESYTISQISRKLNLNHRTVGDRIKRGLDVNEVLKHK